MSPYDAEMLERALGLRAPEFVSRNIYLAKAVGFFAKIWHGVFFRHKIGTRAPHNSFVRKNKDSHRHRKQPKSQLTHLDLTTSNNREPLRNPQGERNSSAKPEFNEQKRPHFPAPPAGERSEYIGALAHVPRNPQLLDRPNKSRFGTGFPAAIQATVMSILSEPKNPPTPYNPLYLVQHNPAESHRQYAGHDAGSSNPRVRIARAAALPANNHPHSTRKAAKCIRDSCLHCLRWNEKRRRRPEKVEYNPGSGILVRVEHQVSEASQSTSSGP